MAYAASIEPKDDMFVKESYKSYQKCQIANSARRNSLMKKTIGIEAQRKLASHEMDREERQLREQLKTMKIGRAKVEADRERKTSQTKHKGHSPPSPTKSQTPGCLDPYPVTFPSGKNSPNPIRRQRSQTITDKAGRLYAARRGRRVSKEFEDLSVNTSTGKLAIPVHLFSVTNPSRSPASSGTPSPSTSRRHLGTLGGGGSHSSLDSTEEHCWVGDPEAIHSVRRPRKSVGQQDKERLLRLRRSKTGIEADK